MLHQDPTAAAAVTALTGWLVQASASVSSLDLHKTVISGKLQNDQQSQPVSHCGISYIKLNSTPAIHLSMPIWQFDTPQRGLPYQKKKHLLFLAN